VPAQELDLVGIGLRAERRTVDKVLDKLRPHSWRKLYDREAEQLNARRKE